MARAATTSGATPNRLDTIYGRFQHNFGRLMTLRLAAETSGRGKRHLYPAGHHWKTRAHQSATREPI